MKQNSPSYKTHDFIRLVAKNSPFLSNKKERAILLLCCNSPSDKVINNLHFPYLPAVRFYLNNQNPADSRFS